MSKNLEMVTLFHSDFYRNKRVELAEIISPDFIYQSPISGPLDFSGYVEFLDQIAVHSYAIKSGITSDDDVVFHLEFSMKILDFIDGFDEEMTGNGTITVKDNLIVRYVIEYDENFLESEKFKKIKNKLMD